MGTDSERGRSADSLRGLYWDTAPAKTDPVIRTLKELAGPGQVMFGTDFPYIRPGLAPDAREYLTTMAELGDDEHRAVLGGNAQRLSPKLGASSSGVC